MLNHNQLCDARFFLGKYLATFSRMAANNAVVVAEASEVVIQMGILDGTRALVIQPSGSIAKSWLPCTNWRNTNTGYDAANTQIDLSFENGNHMFVIIVSSIIKLFMSSIKSALGLLNVDVTFT